MNSSSAKIPISLFLVFTFFCMIFSSCGEQDRYIQITGDAQGGIYQVTINLKGVSKDPSSIKDDMDSILQRIDNSISGYNRGSILSRFNVGERVVPDEIFKELYNVSYDFYELTGGAFDVAAGPLFDLWGFGFKSGEFPDGQTVEQVRKSCGMGHLTRKIEDALDDDGSLVRTDLVKDGEGPVEVVLNFNAIAQGYSCDILARYLYSLGIKDMLINVGGEIYCDGLNPSRRPWRLGVDRPEDGNDVSGAKIEGYLDSSGRPCGIVTSGNYRKFYIKDGKKYAHSIDPRTGYPVDHSLLSATVIAADATAADALATFCMVCGVDLAAEFVRSNCVAAPVLGENGACPKLSGYFIFDEGGTMESIRVE